MAKTIDKNNGEKNEEKTGIFGGKKDEKKDAPKVKTMEVEIPEGVTVEEIEIPPIEENKSTE